jgi:hypothetical protein
VPWDQHAGGNYSLTVGGESCEGVAKYLRATNRSELRYAEIKSRFNSENACCRRRHRALQNLLPSSCCPNIQKIEIWRTIIVPVLYGCETWHGLMMLRLRKVVRPKRDEVTELEEITLQGALWLYSSPDVIQVINSRLSYCTLGTEWTGLIWCRLGISGGLSWMW